MLMINPRSPCRTAGGFSGSGRDMLTHVWVEEEGLSRGAGVARDVVTEFFMGREGSSDGSLEKSRSNSIALQRPVLDSSGQNCRKRYFRVPPGQVFQGGCILREMTAASLALWPTFLCLLVQR